ncbi:MAG TPA: hypothetical protein VFC46_10235, partial [Humisphaera sp.]|nr:hypothetical protein [Humisphaera sp.]
MSIQQRLTRTLIIVVPALAAISGFVIYFTCRARLISEFNQALVTQTRAIGDSVMREATGELEFYFDESDQPEFRKSDQANFFELWRPDGTVFRKSASLGNRDLPKVLSASTTPALQAMTFDGDTKLRAAAVRVVPHLDLDDGPLVSSYPGIANDPLYLVVARDANPLNKMLGTIWNALFWSGIALLISIIGVVTWSVRRSLAPLRRLATEVDTI